MDALAMLREDHRKVRELFRQFEEAPDKATKKAAAETALVELNIHSILEEEIFYPAVRRQGNGTNDLVRRAEQEHHTADQLMDELMKMDAGNVEFEAKFHVLIENVKKHIEEEEAEMLPVAAEVGMARLERLGQQMEQRKQTLLREGNGRAPSRRRASTGTRTRRTTAKAGTRRTTASGTRRSSGTRARASTARAKSAVRTTASRAKTTASRAKTTASRAAKTTASSAKTTASRAKSTAKRTVKQAGTRTRTTKSRSNTSGRRSGSQSGR
jgi:hemerythrin-like domain-containing protein